MTADRYSATASRSDEVADGSVEARQSSLRQSTRWGGTDEVASETTSNDRSTRTPETVPPAPGTDRPGGDTSAERSRDATRVNAFPMRETVLARHYFQSDGAFAILEPYYDRRAYRFEIPRRAFRRIRSRLATHGYELDPVDEVADYAVVVRKYSDHPEAVFENSVVRFSNDDFNVFVMKDRAAVRDAVYGGAERLADAAVTVRFPTAHGTGPLTVRDLASDEG